MKIKVETEEKYYCMEPERLISIAEMQNFKLVKNVVESDEYFTDIDSEYIKNRTCLRIRKSNNETMEVTFKGKSDSLLGQYCKLENNINADINQYENYVTLFSSLGFYSYCEVIKVSMVYKLSTDKYDYSIMIDKISGIGGFVEFEIMSNREDAKRKDLYDALHLFVNKFESLNLKEATKPYRDIVADNVYDNLFKNKEISEIVLNLDDELELLEKDFFKKYKDKITDKLGSNIKWGEYKKNKDVDSKIIDLVDEYLDNMIIDNKELIVCFKLLEKIKYKKSFVTNINEVFYTHLFAKLNIDIKNIIYIQNKLYKSFKDSSNVVILNEKNIRKINSILFMVINHEN